MILLISKQYGMPQNNFKVMLGRLYQIIWIDHNFQRLDAKCFVNTQYIIMLTVDYNCNVDYTYI